MAEWWTNTSLPPSTSINPKPFLSLNHFTRPVIGTSTDCHGIETPCGQYSLLSPLLLCTNLPKKAKHFYSGKTKPCPLPLKAFCTNTANSSLRPIKRETGINKSLPHPDYTL